MRLSQIYRKITNSRAIRDERATTAIEFAAIGPVLLLFIFGVVEIMSAMLASTVLESAVRASSRAGITGYTPTGVTRDNYVKDVVKANLVFLKPDKLVFTTKVYDNFANVGKPEPFTDTNANGVYNVGEPYNDVNGNGSWDLDMGASGSGGPGAIVVYKVTYPWRVVTPFLLKFFGGTGVFNITASTVVMNEPYD